MQDIGSTKFNCFYCAECAFECVLCTVLYCVSVCVRDYKLDLFDAPSSLSLHPIKWDYLLISTILMVRIILRF